MNNEYQESIQEEEDEAAFNEALMELGKEFNFDDAGDAIINSAVIKNMSQCYNLMKTVFEKNEAKVSVSLYEPHRSVVG